MKIARFTAGDDPHYGIVEGEELVVVGGDPLYTAPTPTGQRIPLDREGLRFLSPVIPRSKVVCVGRNYSEHAAELRHEVPEEPLLFLKPNTTVVGPPDPIALPPSSQAAHHARGGPRRPDRAAGLRPGSPPRGRTGRGDLPDVQEPLRRTSRRSDPGLHRRQRRHRPRRPAQ